MKVIDDQDHRLIGGVCCRLQSLTGVHRFYWRVGFTVLHFVYLGTWIYAGIAVAMNTSDQAETGE
jgi:TM2 domain-containing membrane protein YozV